MTEKRKGGQVTEKNGKKIWLVLSESKGKEGEGYTHSCGTQIMGAKVAHPIWDGFFPCSGSGQCWYETIPYCPNCEIQPDFSGSPVGNDPQEEREKEILRRIANK